MKILSLILFLVIFLNGQVRSARILGVFPYYSKSHSILGQALFTKLAERGHEVVYISPFPLKKPPKNYTDIHLSQKNLAESFEQQMDAMFDLTDVNVLFQMEDWFIGTEQSVSATLSDPAVQKLLNDKSQKFDLVILDLLLTEALLGFGIHFNCPIIVISTFGQIHYVNNVVHNPYILSMIAHPFVSFTEDMTFLNRVENVLTTVFENYMLRKHHYPRQKALYKKYFKSDVPFETVIQESVSLAFLNTHYTLNYPIPYLPNLIEIGGFHIKEKAEPLPEDIKTFIDNAEHGVVFFSMGGNLKPSLMPEQKKQDIIAALSKIKQKILWKWDDPNVKVDKNKFLVRKYFPQDGILEHPNTKLFITHGGLLSCTESLVRGTPILGIPIFGDQSINMARVESQGWGVQVKYTNLTEKSLTWALNEVLGSGKYQEKVNESTKKFKDQPQTPMDRAIFWVEYVLRNDGARFMKTTSRHLNFIQYQNLDVYLLILVVLTTTVAIPIFVLCKLLNFFKKSNNQKQKVKSN